MPRPRAARRRRGSRRACRTAPAWHVPAPAPEYPRSASARQTAPVPRSAGPCDPPVMPHGTLRQARGRANTGRNAEAARLAILTSEFRIENGVGPDLVGIDVRQAIGARAAFGELAPHGAVPPFHR